jgi:hypothetical protein
VTAEPLTLVAAVASGMLTGAFLYCLRFGRFTVNAPEPAAEIVKYYVRPAPSSVAVISQNRGRDAP